MHLLNLYPNCILHKLIVLLKKKTVAALEKIKESQMPAPEGLLTALPPCRNYKSHIINKTCLQIFNIV
jgi:hypothetical protein